MEEWWWWELSDKAGVTYSPGAAFWHAARPRATRGRRRIIAMPYPISTTPPPRYTWRGGRWVGITKPNHYGHC